MYEFATNQSERAMQPDSSVGSPILPVTPPKHWRSRLRNVCDDDLKIRGLRARYSRGFILSLGTRCWFDGSAGPARQQHCRSGGANGRPSPDGRGNSSRGSARHCGPYSRISSGHGNRCVVFYRGSDSRFFARTWLNLDLVWAVALVVTGLITLNVTASRTYRPHRLGVAGSCFDKW